MSEVYASERLSFTHPGKGLSGKAKALHYIRFFDPLALKQK